MKTIAKIGGALIVGFIAFVGLCFSLVDDFDTLSKLSDEELRTEREKQFRGFSDKSLDDSEREACRKRMVRIDEELNIRAWGDKEPSPPQYHREHGLNLYKKED